jgi:AcrR family transcriptional regulator
MAQSNLSPAARRIAKAAFRLFAEQGYDRTSIADIHAEVGLTPGTGAVYKHFRSKEDLLERGLDAEYAERDDMTVALATGLPSDPRDALAAIGRAVLDQMRAERDMVRITCRDLEQFPDLLRRVRDERIQPLYSMFAALLSYYAAQGAIRDHDSEATAAVFWGALTYYRICEALIAEPPGRVGEQTFLDAWVDLLWTSLGKPDRARTGGEA